MLRPPSTWSPLPVLGDVTALVGAGMRAALALRSGAVFVSSDGGVRWEATPPLPHHPLVTALLLLPQATLVGTAGWGTLRRENGTGWQPTGSPDCTVLTLTHRDGVVLAGTLRAGVLRSTDGGRTWSLANLGLPLHGDGLEVSQLAATPAGWYALHPFGVSESHDGGLHWHPAVAGLPPRRWPSLLAATGGTLYAGVGGGVYRFGPGARWSLGSAVESVRLVGRAGDALFAMRADGRSLAYSSDAGATWNSYQRGFPAAVTVTTVEATHHAVLATLDGIGIWGRAVPLAPDAA